MTDPEQDPPSGSASDDRRADGPDAQPGPDTPPPGQDAPPPDEAQAPVREASRKGPKAVLATVIVALALAAGGGIWLWQSWGPGAGPSGTNGSAAGDTAPIPAPEFVDPDLISWPEVAPERREMFEKGRQLLLTAAVQYGHDQRDEGTRTMVRALRTLHQSGVSPPELRAYWHETAHDAIQAGDLAVVEGRVREWMLHYPNDLFAVQLLMLACYEQGKWESAARFAGLLVERRPSHAKAVECLAISLYRLQRWPDAVPAARRLCDLTPDRTDAWRLLATCAFSLGAKETGVAAVRKMLSLVGYPEERAWKHPEAEKVLLSSLKTLHRFQEFPELAEVAAFYRTRHPDSGTALMAEGAARLQIGEAEAAEALLRRALEGGLGGDRDEVRFQLALAVLKQKRFEDAAAAFAALLADDPNFDRAYYQMGQCLHRLKRPEPAEALIARSRELASSERAIRRVIEMRSAGQMVEAARSLSLGYLARGQIAEAEQAILDRSLDRDPRNIIHRLEHYLACLRVGDARAEWERLRAILPPEQQDVEGNGARVEWAEGRREDAIARLEALVEREGTSPLWKRELGERYLEVGRAADVVPLIEPLRKAAENREESWILGRAWLRTGEPARALEVFRSISPDDTRREEWEITVWLAHAQAAAGESPRKALRTWKETVPWRRGSLQAQRAHVAILEALRAEDPDAPAPEELAAATESLSRAERLQPEIRVLELKIATERWPASGPLYLALARRERESGDRVAALHWARVARAADPDSAEILEELIRQLDRESDVFYRLRWLRELARRRPEDGAVRKRLETLESAWFLR